ncbi:outer membrane lipoprotein Blc [Salinisphaera hydrothermalis C41B8]|uniref:Outer membrane lipoprotein Blc n=1 Tax=Salinisphaera hydrothermalis (strain C41B8) TaxID=1304275 RepID=A0A084IPC7_SALHC|nr:lipocalin family protein [Salinisphaera hydrothermalis]KEZ78561.1 outer membrane lipoprotein Blc [Salinisphaera hydrothermalis C41B8]
MSVSSWIRVVTACLVSGVLSGCVGLPKGTTAVQPFSLNHYLGRWYEIARLDHRFEKGLDCVTATYSKRADGGVRVVNRGVNLAKDKVSEAVGKAYFVAGDNTGRFKVSFFGPFYAGYNVIALDPDYRHALIAGPNRDYLWILSRTPRLSAATRAALIQRAADLGFPTDELVFPDQGSACAPYRKDSGDSQATAYVHNDGTPRTTGNGS